MSLAAAKATPPNAMMGAVIRFDQDLPISAVFLPKSLKLLDIFCAVLCVFFSKSEALSLTSLNPDLISLTFATKDACNSLTLAKLLPPFYYFFVCLILQ